MWWSLRLHGVTLADAVEGCSEVKMRSIIVLEFSVILVGVDINCFSWSSMVVVNKSLVGLELGARVLQLKSPSNRHALFVSEQTLDNIDSK